MRKPRNRKLLEITRETATDIQSALQQAGIAVESYCIDAVAYRDFVATARYDLHPDYYANGSPEFAEKSLEHFLAADLLGLQKGEVYIDVASDCSPAAEIYTRVYGVEAYRQDLQFPPGIQGRMIGGNAAAMPIEAGFADRMALHCSFEHFEGDDDIRFIQECARVLKPGGRVCFLPLYLHTEYAILTDTGSYPLDNMPDFEKAVPVHNVAWWGQRHGRFYNVEKLEQRILRNLGSLQARILRVENPEVVSPNCYVQFVLVLEKLYAEVIA